MLLNSFMMILVLTLIESSLLKIQEIGPYDINTHRMYIKFGCYEAIEEMKL